jgi:hypothetical protein
MPASARLRVPDRQVLRAAIAVMHQIAGVGVAPIVDGRSACQRSVSLWMRARAGRDASPLTFIQISLCGVIAFIATLVTSAAVIAASVRAGSRTAAPSSAQSPRTASTERCSYETRSRRRNAVRQFRSLRPAVKPSTVCDGTIEHRWWTAKAVVHSSRAAFLDNGSCRREALLRNKGCVR